MLGEKYFFKKAFHFCTLYQRRLFSTSAKGLEYNTLFCPAVLSDRLDKWAVWTYDCVKKTGIKKPYPSSDANSHVNICIVMLLPVMFFHKCWDSDVDFFSKCKSVVLEMVAEMQPGQHKETAGKMDKPGFLEIAEPYLSIHRFPGCAQKFFQVLIIGRRTDAKLRTCENTC